MFENLKRGLEARRWGQGDHLGPQQPYRRRAGDGMGAMGRSTWATRPEEWAKGRADRLRTTGGPLRRHAWDGTPKPGGHPSPEAGGLMREAGPDASF
jgi:hypothetical protein